MTILLDQNARPVIGHRGNRTFSPENTIESMREAVSVGADAIEFDVHVTKDGVPVVHHDPTLDRTTNAKGLISDRTLAELSDIDAGYRFSRDLGRTFPWRGRGVKIPSLDSVMEEFPLLPMIIEIKTPTATDAVKQVVMRHAAEKRVIVAGFDINSVRPLAGGPIQLGASTAELIQQMPAAFFGGKGPDASFVAACIPQVYKGLPVPLGRISRLMKRRGGVVHVWTVNEAEDALKLWKLGVQGIISDDPHTIINARRELREL